MYFVEACLRSHINVNANVNKDQNEEDMYDHWGYDFVWRLECMMKDNK